MINAGMVFCDRHYGGINYPVGGVGRISEVLADGLREHGSYVVYKANVRTHENPESSGSTSTSSLSLPPLLLYFGSLNQHLHWSILPCASEAHSVCCRHRMLPTGRPCHVLSALPFLSRGQQI